MHQYRFLEHTADIRIRLEGDRFHELLTAGVLAIGEILKPGYCGDQKPSCPLVRTVKLVSADRTALLIDFLSDVLTQSHMDQAIFCAVTIIHLSETEIDAVILGNPVISFDDDIKAVTYHEADVRMDDRGTWTSMVIVDI